MRRSPLSWLLTLGGVFLAERPAAAQCQAAGITVTPVSTPCSNLPALVPVFEPSACSIDLHYFPYVAQWIPYRSWIALGVSSQLVLYPELLGACPQQMSPIAIVPLTGSALRVPLPPGSVGFSFVASAVTLFYEPNTASWFLAPGRQAMWIVVT